VNVEAGRSRRKVMVGPRYEQGYEQDLIGATARIRDDPRTDLMVFVADDPGDKPHRWGVIEDETVEKVKIRWPFGGSDWAHKRDIIVLG
jgi:hypothetical protein